jgi:predicted P-loop ATPase
MIRVPVAIFDNVGGKTMTTVDMSVEELHEMVVTTTAATKDDLPLFVYGRFGANRTADGSLRHDANLLARTGWVVEHDAGTMSFEEVKTRVETAGIACFGYTTGRHTAAAPRWRLGGPFSKELTAAEMPRMLGRINGLLGGEVAAESAKLTQSWFIGRVDGALFDRFFTVHDENLDEASELDTSAIPIRGAPKPKPAKKGAPDYGELSRDELEELIKASAHYFGPANELLRRDAYDEIPRADAEANLRDVFDKVPTQQRDRAWTQARSSIGRWAQHVYANVAKRKGHLFRNLVTYLPAGEWRGLIRLNLFTQSTEVCDPFPPQPGQTSGIYRELLDPEDLLEVMMCAQENGFPNVGKNLVRDALRVVAKARSYHPVRDWLKSLEWDDRERIRALFFDYFPAELPNPAETKRYQELIDYFENVALCFMVGAVARVFKPGCKVDCLPVLIGKQGWNKSRGIQALVPAPVWFSDDISTSLLDRDTKESLNGKWLIELAEFPHIKKEVERVKGFFSRQTDRYRRAYDYANRDWGRQCVFIASTNELVFIDTTGNRRFWPVPLRDPAKIEAVERDREQLWAEAMRRLDDDFAWWLPPSLEAIAAEMQAAFLEDDILDEPVGNWVAHKAPRDRQTEKRLPFTTNMVLQGLGYALTPPHSTLNLGINDRRPVAAKAEQNRAAASLKRLGFARDRYPRRVGGHRERFWTHPDDE